jgi:hypothetical protein
MFSFHNHYNNIFAFFYYFSNIENHLFLMPSWLSQFGQATKFPSRSFVGNLVIPLGCFFLLIFYSTISKCNKSSNPLSDVVLTSFPIITLLSRLGDDQSPPQRTLTPIIADIPRTNPPR